MVEAGPRWKLGEMLDKWTRLKLNIRAGTYWKFLLLSTKSGPLRDLFKATLSLTVTSFTLKKI